MALRPARPSDLSAIDTPLGRSYPRLLAADYPPSVLVTALPRIVRAKPALLASGTYFVIEEAGAILAGGGWSRGAPQGSGTAGTGHVRHVVTDPDHLRRGSHGWTACPPARPGRSTRRRASRRSARWT